MAKFKKQLNRFIKKIKTNRSLQVKLAIVVGIVLLYHFLFGDVANRNVKIQSIELKNANREAVYSVSLEDNKLKIHEYLNKDLENQYCKNIDDHYKLHTVRSFDPIIVECRAGKKIRNIIETNGTEFQEFGYFEPNKFDNEAIIVRRLLSNIKDNELIIPQNINFSIEEIENKYCKKFNLKLRKILKTEPMKVACGHPDSAKIKYVTNGKWMYWVDSYDVGFAGQNKEYLIREDYSLVNKITGDIIKDNVINGKAKAKGYSNIKLGSIGVVAASKNKRFFISEQNFFVVTLKEIDKNGEKTTVRAFFAFGLLEYPRIAAMIASNDGNYVYLLVETTPRGSVDLLFYIMDVKSKSTVFKKTLESNVSSMYNINIRQHQENIYFSYIVGSTLKAFKAHHKNKQRVKK